MVTWLIYWFAAPYVFPFLFYEQFIFIIFWRSYVVVVLPQETTVPNIEQKQRHLSRQQP